MRSSDKSPNSLEDYLNTPARAENKSQESSAKNETQPESVKSAQPHPKDQRNDKPAQSYPTEHSKDHKISYNPASSLQQVNPDENMVAEIRRHPIGLTYLYALVIGGLAASFILIILLMPGFADFLGIDNLTFGFLMAIFMIVMTVLGFIFLVIGTKLYKQNRLIITDTNITQVSMIGVFNKKVSELTMASVEDVTAHSSGMMQTLFKYGTIVIETAGEQNNFIFKFAPKPDSYAKVIQDAKADFIRRHYIAH